MIAFAINGVIFSFFTKELKPYNESTDPHYNMAKVGDTFDETHIVLQSLGLIHIGITISLVILWLIIHAPLSLMKGWGLKFIDLKKKVMSNMDPNDDQDQIILGYLSKSMINVRRTEIQKIIEHVNVKEELPVNMPAIEYWATCFKIILSDSLFRALAVLGMISVVAYTKQVVIFYAFH